MQNYMLALFFSLFLLLHTLPFTIHAQNSILLNDQKVIYDLPYPGLLPDHPLYFLKNMRDKIVIAGTRDSIKKAEHYHLLSDKYMSMTKQLSDKGKEQLAIKTAEQGEAYFEKIIPLMITSKEQGVGPSDDFKRKLTNSNIKHAEVLENLLKETPQGNVEMVTKVLRMNAEIYKDLEKVK